MEQAEQEAANADAPAKRRRRMTREPIEGSVAVAPPRSTKASLVNALLLREAGATIGMLCEATRWQPHTCRAFLTRLRKAGKPLEKRKLEDGTTSYRLDQSA